MNDAFAAKLARRKLFRYGTAGLARSRVSGSSLAPLPPASTTVATSRIRIVSTSRERISEPSLRMERAWSWDDSNGSNKRRHYKGAFGFRRSEILGSPDPRSIQRPKERHFYSFFTRTSGLAWTAGVFYDPAACFPPTACLPRKSDHGTPVKGFPPS